MDKQSIFKKLKEEGFTIKEIGAKYNLTHQRVSQIINKKKVTYKKLKPVKIKTYLDYLKESDYSSKLKSIYIKNYANFTAEESV
jgi:orotate phosphoribosyltransferase-like protein